jgi:hypothetical protein
MEQILEETQNIVSNLLPTFVVWMHKLENSPTYVKGKMIFKFAILIIMLIRLARLYFFKKQTHIKSHIGVSMVTTCINIIAVIMAGRSMLKDEKIEAEAKKIKNEERKLISDIEEDVKELKDSGIKIPIPNYDDVINSNKPQKPNTTGPNCGYWCNLPSPYNDDGKPMFGSF